jgi:hypothetical protein
MSSFSLFDHKRGHCGLNKLLPAERLSTFTILHYYQQRHVSWTPVFISAENLNVGAEYTTRGKRDIPPCWQEIVQRNEQLQQQTLSPTKSPIAAPVAHAEAQ